MSAASLEMQQKVARDQGDFHGSCNLQLSLPVYISTCRNWCYLNKSISLCGVPDARNMNNAWLFPPINFRSGITSLANSAMYSGLNQTMAPKNRMLCISILTNYIIHTRLQYNWPRNQITYLTLQNHVFCLELLMFLYITNIYCQCDENN